ncbi:Mitogen-activated protein kinase kinase kinase ANP1 [Apostasia shenzhenica]|uniref:Mitogen-activated protein kinase kinase kinase ANP1 n=1 Tax=Apostasia shenzhenica TaxID=1088818 RepID=A0A2I0BBV4_9ASPA|nr:Mitogen-activated protein kinase kinase kinase ANP1 [Apostasia shenzhenica]
MIAAGGWTLGRSLGRGATATVSLASAVPSGHLFAVKFAPVSRSSLLQREQSILASLSSPHIISCLGSDVSGDSYHLFLELAAGGAISDLAGSIDEPMVRSFTRQILLGLSYIHSNGIAHCDIKGRNILISSDGQVKLADFGCAVRVSGGCAAADGSVMGTPAYMAPEVARGEEQGIAGDIWSLGCTVLEMVTGKSPWPEIADPVATIHRVGFSSDVPALPELVSDEAKDFISKCLRRDPSERWTAEELLQHPFVLPESEISLRPSNCPKLGEKRVSPKSTLEYGFWESEAEGDEETATSPESLCDRIRQLGSPPANWTWDKSWISIRDGEEECESPTVQDFEGSSGVAGGELSGREFADNSDEEGISFSDLTYSEEESSMFSQRTEHAAEYNNVDMVKFQSTIIRSIFLSRF